MFVGMPVAFRLVKLFARLAPEHDHHNLPRSTCLLDSLRSERNPGGNYHKPERDQMVPNPEFSQEKANKDRGEFALFKPLFGIAIAAILFEMLPMDFQHVIAPSLVSYEEVFFADCRTEDFAYTSDDYMNDRLILGNHSDPVEVSIN